MIRTASTHEVPIACSKTAKAVPPPLVTAAGSDTEKVVASSRT